MSSPQTSSSRRFRELRDEFHRHLAVTQRAQSDLRAYVHHQRAQDDWDEATVAGVEEWVDDMDGIWRALRRNRYDLAKTHTSLLLALSNRLRLSLHGRIPNYLPYSNSALFYILPLPQQTDKLGRPIIVLTLREVQRDENVKLDVLKEWSWFALEWVRRVLRDWWVLNEQDGGRRGKGGEGCVILVDAAGASYRNLEVELLPTLLSVGHNNYPGIFETVYVVNMKWTHRSMWAVIKRLLPRSALEKVQFLENKQDLEQVFDLDHLPAVYGGQDPFVFDASTYDMLDRYRTLTDQTATTGTARLSLHSASSNSIADVYHTARNTPSASPTPSPRSSTSQARLASTGCNMVPSENTDPYDPKEAIHLPNGVDHSPQHVDLDGHHNPSESSTPSRDHLTEQSSFSSSPLQRIKSLTDFHLYLSPSRLAHIDLLTDSSGENHTSPPAAHITPLSPRPVARRPESERAHPPSRLLGAGLPVKTAQRDGTQSYSDRLQIHHAKALEQYRQTRPVSDRFSTDVSTPLAADADKAASNDNDAVGLKPSRNSSQMPAQSQSSSESLHRSLSQSSNPPEPSVLSSPSQPSAPIRPTQQSQPSIQQISPFSLKQNPWYGYPAIRLSTGHLQPRYNRNRNRDLLKTLLFLFLLRAQSWRDGIERFLGLYSSYRPLPKAMNPREGLMRMRGFDGDGAGDGTELVTGGKTGDRDFVWMILGVLLTRGTWGRVILEPLERLGLGLGLGLLRGMLGMV